MPYGADRDAGDQVDPPFPVSPVQVDSFGALHFEHHRVIGCLSDVFEEQLSEICRHVRMILPAKIRKSSGPPVRSGAISPAGCVSGRFCEKRQMLNLELTSTASNA